MNWRDGSVASMHASVIASMYGEQISVIRLLVFIVLFIPALLLFDSMLPLRWTKMNIILSSSSIADSTA